MMADNKDGQSAICHESVSNEVGRIVEQELKQEVGKDCPDHNSSNGG
jgi:hypothetical protein